MKTALAAIGLIWATAGAIPAVADDSVAPEAAPAQIPFANHGGIWDWKADGKDAILIKSRDRHYYRATFMAPCFELPFAEHVGFVTDARDVLDRFDSIVVDRDHCYFNSFQAIPRPGTW